MNASFSSSSSYQSFHYWQWWSELTYSSLPLDLVPTVRLEWWPSQHHVERHGYELLVPVYDRESPQLVTVCMFMHVYVCGHVQASTFEYHLMNAHIHDCIACAFNSLSQSLDSDLIHDCHCQSHS